MLQQRCGLRRHRCQRRGGRPRGGRPDLAGLRLADVHAPTLLIVGALDTRVADLNREALEHLGDDALLIQVPGATHLFEEPGTLAAVAEIARGLLR